MNWIKLKIQSGYARQICMRLAVRQLYRLSYRSEHLDSCLDNLKVAKLSLVHVNNAAELLYICSLVPLSSQIYLPPSHCKSLNNKWLKSLGIKPIPNSNFIKQLIAALQTKSSVIIISHGHSTKAQWNLYKRIAIIAEQFHIDLLTLACAKHSRAFNHLRAVMRTASGSAISSLSPYRIHQSLMNAVYHSQVKHERIINSLLNASKIHRYNKIIIADADQQLSYRKLLLSCFVLGRKFKLITKPKEKVGILLPNVLANAVSFFALQTIDRIPAMLNFTSGSHALKSSCQAATINQIISSRKFIEAANLNNLVNNLSCAKIKIIYLEDLKLKINPFDKLLGLIKFYLAPLYLYSSSANINEEALLLFTSGSEGEPKGVALSHANIQANCQQIRSSVAFTSKDILFNPLPLFHSFGLTAGLLLPILSGTKSILYPSPLHFQQIPKAIQKSRATILFGTDTFLCGYAHYADANALKTLKYVFAGAEKLKNSTKAIWLEKFKISIFEGYGATEASPVLSLNTPLINKPGSVGCFLPAINYRLYPLAGLKEGGRLSVAGPNLMLGYYLAKTPGILKSHSSWHDTGDIAEIDQFGFVTLLGRAKRFAKVAGEMISLLAVENYIHALWPDFAHAVISKAHPTRGEILVLVTNHTAATREALIAYAHSHGINELSIPKKIITITELPLLPTGKVDYQRLNELN